MRFVSHPPMLCGFLQIAGKLGKVCLRLYLSVCWSGTLVRREEDTMISIFSVFNVHQFLEKSMDYLLRSGAVFHFEDFPRGLGYRIPINRLERCVRRWIEVLREDQIWCSYDLRTHIGASWLDPQCDHLHWPVLLEGWPPRLESASRFGICWEGQF